MVMPNINCIIVILSYNSYPINYCINLYINQKFSNFTLILIFSFILQMNQYLIHLTHFIDLTSYLILIIINQSPH